MSSVFPNTHEEKIQIVGNLLIQQVSLSTGGLHVKKEEKKKCIFYKREVSMEWEFLLACPGSGSVCMFHFVVFVTTFLD